MSRLHRALRRTGVVVTASLVVAGLPAAVAVAATGGTVTQSSPPFVANTGSATAITFTLSSEPTSPGEVLVVELTGPGGAIADTGTPSVDGSTVTATFDLRGASPGVYAVSVADMTGAIDEYECASCLQVLATPPTVSAVSPATRGAGAPATTFAVTGTNLFAGATVRFLRAGAHDTTIAYPATGSLTVSSDNRTLTGPLAVGSTAVPGPRDVEVTNTDGQKGVCADCLTITPAPSFVSLSPDSAGQGAVGRSLTLLGADYQPGLTAAFLMTGSTTDAGGVTVTSVTLDGDGAATLVVNVADTSTTTTTTRDLVLTNPDGGTTRTANALTVTPEPAVSSLTPSTLDGGAQGEQLVVAGSNLSSAPDFSFSGTGITVNGYTPDNATAATKGYLDVTLAPGATVGGRTLTVTNPDGGRSTSGTVLTVGATPAITSISPASLGRGASGRTVTISGSGFDTGGVEVTIPGLTVTNEAASSATTITATVSVPHDAAVGMLDLSVLNTAAGRRGRTTCAGCFAVDSFAVDSITPSAVLNSSTYDLEIAGSGLPTGETVTATLTRAVARTGQDPIVFEGVVNGDGTRFNGTADLRAVAPGAYRVRLSQGDAVGTCSCTFNVVAESSPALTSVSPSSLPQGATGEELTLRGSGFTKGADVTFGSGVTKAGAVTFVDTTTLRVPVDVAPDAAAAAVPVTVHIPSFGADTQATCGACFAVSRRPTVTSAASSSRGQGAPPAAMSVAGTDFQPDATVSLGEGVTVTNVVRSSPTQLTFTAAVADDAAVGPRIVTVTNPDGGVGTCECFAVTARPLATAVTPATGGQGRTAVPVMLTGSGFQHGATVSFGSDVVSSSGSGGGNTLEVTLNLANANLGPHDVSVTNPDGGSATCDCVFTVHVVPTVTSVSPSSRGAGAAAQPVTITGTNFTEGATVAFAGAGVTVVDSDVVDATRIDAVVTVAGDAAPGARSVTVTNLDTGQAGDCNACFTVNPKPTVSPANHTAQRNRSGLTATFAGSGFQPGAVGADLGDGITVTNAQATSSSSVTVTFDVGNAASLGARDVTFVNGDGGRATCAGCVTVTTPRAFTIAVDASPVSGAAQSVTVTAHVSSDEGSATDTSYTGVPVLTAAGDGHFDDGTCGAAVSGVSTCSGVVFGDLGPVAMNVSGTGADSDLGGTRDVVVEPPSLVFQPGPPGGAAVGDSVSFTVRPVAGVTGASITDYAAARTAHVTGGDAATVPLSCGAAVCTFALTFSSPGEKTVRVSDDSTPSASTHTATLIVSTGTRIDDFRVSRTRIVAGQSITMRGTLRDSAGTALGGQSVRIYVTGGGFSSWVRWHTVTTDGTGGFAKTARMTRTRTIKAVFLPPDATYARSDSVSRTVGVATRVTITSPKSGSRVAAGRTFVVRGTTYPAKPGVTAYLFWRRSDGRVVLLRRATITSRGTFALSKALRRGTYTLQVGVPAAAGNLRGRSAYFTLRVV